MKNKVSLLSLIPFAGITQNSINKNGYEQRVLKDYISKKKFSIYQFRDDMLNKCEADGDWEIEDTAGNTQTLHKNSAICMSCAATVWETAIYMYRKSIHNELPANVKNRDKCWYGTECRTQGHNYAHASKLSHI